MGNRLISNLNQKASYSNPSINPIEAIEAAAKQLDIKEPTGLKALEPISSQHFIYKLRYLKKIANISKEFRRYIKTNKKLRVNYIIITVK